MRSLDESWQLGSLTIPNRVVLAPLAGIGNWFVRLQAKRFGAGLAVSEMISSHAIHYENPKTLNELLVVRPEEKAGGPVALQLFGGDPGIMREAAGRAAEVGADAIDINMGCPVPKVTRTGAGVALLSDPDRAVAVARAAAEGSGLPVVVKLRAGRRIGENEGFDLALRLADEAGVAGISFHPRSAQVQHKGRPDYELAAALAAELPVPMILSGGMNDAVHIERVFADTGVAAIMLARGCLGNPWLFEQTLGRRSDDPSREEVLDELVWVVDRCVEHLGEQRAARYLRKFYPWYLDRLGETSATQDAFQRTESIAEQREQVTRLRALQPA